MENDARANLSLGRAGQGQILSRGLSKERVRGAWISWACREKQNEPMVTQSDPHVRLLSQRLMEMQNPCLIRGWPSVVHPSVASHGSVIPSLVLSGVSELQCAS
jgi:hypothetical protein